MSDRAAQEALNQFVDAVVQRRREQQPLATRGRGGENARDTRQEAEVGHVVSLVEHRDLDGVQGDVPLLHQVFEAAGSRDDDVDARRSAVTCLLCETPPIYWKRYNM